MSDCINVEKKDEGEGLGKSGNINKPKDESGENLELIGKIYKIKG